MAAGDFRIELSEQAALTLSNRIRFHIKNGRRINLRLFIAWARQAAKAHPVKD